jgi:hypothetical protein
MGTSNHDAPALSTQLPEPSNLLLQHATMLDNPTVQTEPSNTDQPKGNRRWFQYSLRSLMIGVTLLAVPCGYIGWQAKIVRERKSLLERIDGVNGPILSHSEVIDGFGDHAGFVELPWIRKSMGDIPIDLIDLIHDAPPEIVREIKAAFPEAAIIVIPPPGFRLSDLDPKRSSQPAAQPSSQMARSRRP